MPDIFNGKHLCVPHVQRHVCRVFLMYRDMCAVCSSCTETCVPCVQSTSQNTLVVEASNSSVRCIDLRTV